jgi:ribosome recycling factor
MPPSTRKIYERSSKKYKRELFRLIDRAAKENVALLRDVRRDVAERLLSANKIDSLPQFRRQTQRSFQRYGDELIRKVDRQLERAWNLGKDAIDAPLRRAGHDLRVGGLPISSFDTQRLENYREEVHDAIRNISADGARRINNAATFGVIGGREPERIMSDIGRYVTRGAFKKVSLQVESMTKTETARIFNLSMRERLKQAGNEISGIKKFWQHIADGKARPAHSDVGERTNPDFGGKAIEYNADFRVGGERAFAPFDPRLSDKNSYGCRCALGFFVEEK